MTVITCGVTYLDHRAETYVKGMRESQGFVVGGGCGSDFNLDNPIQAARIYRCLECSRWLCKPCIVAHFEETSDAYQPTETERRAADPDSPSVESTDKEGTYRPSPADMACGRGDHRAETSERQRASRAAATQHPHAPCPSART